MSSCCCFFSFVSSFLLLSLQKTAQLEKLEFSDHCERLLGAVTAFKQELQEKQDAKLIEEDTNAKFGKLMNKIEEISIKLGERNVEYRLLSGTASQEGRKRRGGLYCSFFMRNHTDAVCVLLLLLLLARLEIDR